MRLFGVPALLSAALIQLPLPAPTSPHAALERTLSCYVANAFRPYALGALPCTGDSLEINPGDLAPPWSDGLDAAAAGGFTALRAYWQAHSNESRAVRGQALPGHVSDLPDFTAWPRRVIAKSAVKRQTRVIYRSPDGVVPGTSVAVTLATDTGDLSAPVVDTELAVDRRDGSGDADFYVYDAAGALVDRAPFPSGDKPSPSICVSCHYRAATGRVPRQGPSLGAVLGVEE